MSDARWEISVAPTADEAYEAMIKGGAMLLRGRARAVVIVQTILASFFAPLGATMALWVLVELSGGPGFRDLPVFALPVTFVAFVLLSLWLTHRVHYTMAQVTVGSGFGRAYTVVLAPDGITIVTLHSRWHSGWSDVEVVTGGTESLGVGISGIVIPLPRCAFLGPQDADEALATMQRWKEAAP